MTAGRATRDRALIEDIRTRLPALPTPALYRVCATLEAILGRNEITAADYRRLAAAARTKARVSRR